MTLKLLVAPVMQVQPPAEARATGGGNAFTDVIKRLENRYMVRMAHVTYLPHRIL